MTTDPRIVRLKTPEACEQFAINVEKRGKPDLANEARRHAVELLAGKHGAATPATLDGWRTTYAYERHVLSTPSRKGRASRIRQMIERHGMIGTIERLVTRPVPSTGYVELAKVGMLDLTAEAVVLRHPEEFSPEAIARSKERLEGSRPQDLR